MLVSYVLMQTMLLNACEIMYVKKLLFVCGFGLKCLSNNKASVWLLWIALCVGKKLCLVGLAHSPKCMYCGDWEKSIEHAFFYCNLVHSLCKFVECYMICKLGGNVFVFKASSICSNVVLSLKNDVHSVLMLTC